MNDPETTPNNDIFLYDFDALSSIASDAIVAKGLNYFKERRVMELAFDADGVWAQVEGSDPETPYDVELRADTAGQFEAYCSCPFDREAICKHTVAVLFAYAGRRAEEDDLIGNAAETAIQERQKKGRTEIRVKHVSGDLHFGIWRASSIVSSTHWHQTYQVQIRSLDDRKNYCSCPDWSTNQLGTCKHIEGVLHQIEKNPDYQTGKTDGQSTPFVYLAWDSSAGPTIKLHRTGDLNDDLIGTLNRFFDAADEFQGQLPDDFFRFTELAHGRDDIHIGEDTKNFARRCAEDSAQQIRAQRITESIQQSNGVIPRVRAKLYPYQLEGVAFLSSRGRALLADDMGLGKTLQAICAASWMVEHRGIKRVLVVCPASLKHQWAREIEKFTTHEAKIIQGKAEARHVQYRADKTFSIINYELVLRDLSVINETLSADLVILDEAQRIKNWQTKTASTIKLIASRYAFVLTGTPLENRLEDLYSLMQVVDPRVLGPLWRYLIDFHVTDDRDKVIGYRNLSELRKRIAPVMLRRDRSLVSNQLPDRTETRLDIPLSPKQLELHGSALSAAGQLADIAKKRPLTPSEQNRLMAALQQARMACDAAGLVDKTTEGSPKLDELANLLEDLCLQGNQKVVIFSQWERMTKMVESTARKMGIGFVRLHGGVPTGKRGELIDRFQNDDAIQVFISTDAGGVGLNLQSATALVNLDIPWNPAVLEQRIARIHRLGQKKKVQIILLLADDSYEQHVFSLVKNKRVLFDNVVDPNAEEDVVGVSKRMLETIIEDLGGTTSTSVANDTKVSQHENLDIEAARTNDNRPAESEQDSEVRQLIGRIQDAFGERVERIIGSGGGLLVVMDTVDDATEKTAQSLSTSLPVALIDPRTLAGLDRLGSASPLNNSKELYQAEKGSTDTSRFSVLAKSKLKAAEVLVEQQCMTAAIELLTSAMLAAVTAKAQLATILSTEKAGVWIYSEAIPRGYLTPDQGVTLIRAIALVSAPEIPENLVFEVMEDARKLIV